jgi:hypothetical protein
MDGLLAWQVLLTMMVLAVEELALLAQAVVVEPYKLGP